MHTHTCTAQRVSSNCRACIFILLVGTCVCVCARVLWTWTHLCHGMAEETHSTVRLYFYDILLYSSEPCMFTCFCGGFCSLCSLMIRVVAAAAAAARCRRLS